MISSAGFGAEFDRTDDQRRQGLAMWAVGYAVLVPLGYLLLLIEHQPHHLYVAIGLAPLSYLLYLVTPFRRNARWPANAYLLVASLSVVWLCANDWRQLGLLCLLASQVFALVGVARRALVINGVIGAATVLTAFALTRVGLATFTDVLIVTSVTFGVGIMILLYVANLAEENRRQGRLIAELEAARADLDRAHHEAGVTAERERLSQEIHDTLAQGFTSLLMLIQAAAAALPGEATAARDRLSLAAEVARENVREAQALVAATAPADLDDSSLESALHRLVSRTTDEVEIAGEFQVTGTPRHVDPKIQVILLRSAQEALANVRKHAEAQQVAVRLVYRTETVLLEVIDDGRGFDPDDLGTRSPTGFGLSGMRQRARQANGTVCVVSTPGEGTRIAVELR